MTKANPVEIPSALPAAVDLLNEAEFYGRTLPKRVRDGAALAIAARLGGETAYAGGFALTAEEREAGFRVFTGEVMTNAAARHIATQEATRALRLLDGLPAAAKRAAERGHELLLRGVTSRIDARYDGAGIFCCGNCDVSVWRHLAAGGLNRPEDRLPFAMRTLRQYRDGKGGWRRHPFYYTVLSLTDVITRAGVATEAARDELEYAAPAMERRLRRSPSGQAPYAQRRHDVMRVALDLV
jgi:hypothetical protein